MDMRDHSDDLKKILTFKDDGIRNKNSKNPEWMSEVQIEFFDNTKKKTALYQVFELYNKTNDSDTNCLSS